MICTICGHYARPAQLSKDMRDFLRLFVQIALLRRGPQDLPASMLLLALTVLGYVCVNLLLSSALPPDPHWLALVLVDTAFMLLWYLALLRLVGRPERFLQTTTAVFGIQLVLSPLLIASEWLVRRFGEDGSQWQLAVVCVWLLAISWVITANSYIVRAALDWSPTSSVVLVILQTVAGGLVEFAMFPPLKS